VVIVYCLQIDIADLPMQKNDDYLWLPAKEIVGHDKIHGHTKAYFK